VLPQTPLRDRKLHRLLGRHSEIQGGLNLSIVFAGRNVGIKEVSEKIWLVTFMNYDLGFFDHEQGRVECAKNSFEAKVLPMSPV
jgi:hypothetical protein